MKRPQHHQRPNAPMIQYYNTRMTGELRAVCSGCGSVWAYWDDIDDLAHACWIICPQCDGEGESVPIWDKDTHTTARQVCSGCSGNGSIRQIVEV